MKIQSFSEFRTYLREKAWTREVIVSPEDFEYIGERVGGRLIEIPESSPTGLGPRMGIRLMISGHAVYVRSSIPPPAPDGVTDLSSDGPLFK